MNLDELAYELEKCKAAEKAARIERIKAENALIEAVGLKEEGTTTTKTGWYRISTVAKLNRKLIAEDIPDKLYHAITRVKHELDVTALKKLASSHPEQYREACRFIATTPAKPSVKIERIEPTNQQAT